MEVETAVNVVKWIMVDPIAEVAGQLGVGGQRS
jgi:hypothetical protein